MGAVPGPFARSNRAKAEEQRSEERKQMITVAETLEGAWRGAPGEEWASSVATASGSCTSCWGAWPTLVDQGDRGDVR